MSDEEPPAERRNHDAEILEALNNNTGRLESLAGRMEANTRSLTRQLEVVRVKQERQLAVVLALQEHKTIERVDVIWETLARWRNWGDLGQAVAIRLVRLGAWGCGTLLALGALYVAAEAAGIIHFP